MAQKDAIALCALGDLHHHGKTTNGFDGVLHVEDVPHIDRFGNWNPITGQDLGCVEFVSALENALARVGRPDTELFDVAEHGYAVLGDGMADAGDDGVFGEGTPFVEHVNAALVDDQ